MKTNFIPTILLLFALVACAEPENATSPKPESRPEEIITPVRTVQAKISTLQTSKTVAATVLAATDSSVVAEASGRVLRQLRQVGQSVAKGEAVLELDVSNLRDQLSEARLLLESANVNLRTAQTQNPEDLAQAQKRQIAVQTALENANRLKNANQELYGMGAISQAELLQSVSSAALAAAELEAAKASVARLNRASREGLEGLRLAVQQAQTRIRQLERDVARGQVVAPFTGEIAEVFVQQGEFLSAGSRAFRLLDPATKRVGFAVPQSDAAKLALGRGAWLRLGAQRLELRISRNAAVPSEDRLVKIQARFVGQPPVKVGSAGTLEYRIVGGTGALLPIAALRLEADRKYVFLVQNGSSVERTVQILGEASGQVVVSGIEAGERVVYPVPSSLADNTKVRVVQP
jgi:HlyD family secretion protein